MRNVTITLQLLFVFFLIGCKKEEEKKELFTTSDVTEGQIVVSPYAGTQSGRLLLLDKNGNTLVERTTEAETFNFQKWEKDGKVRYTYLVHDVHTPSLIEKAITPCYGVVTDENLHEIKRVTLLPYGNRTSEGLAAIESHEFVYIDDNHFITVAYYEKEVSNIPASLNPASNSKVITAVIQETKDDQVVWEWSGDDYPEFYTASVEGNAFSNASVKHDYMHINSVFIDPRDNHLICSFRNMNQVIKINRTTGEIMWRLGGKNSDFPLTANMKFLRQHHATITDDQQTLLLYDNGEATERPYSRVLEFKLDDENKTITSFQSLDVPNHIFSQYMGSVQKRGDTYFIGCGSVPKIMEVNHQTGKVNFLMQLDDNTYRAFKY